jgi:hypothetical protein
MRLCALVIATILLISVSLLAQRGGGGASSAGGHSSGSSGGSFHGGSSGSPGSSRSSVTASPSAFPSSQRSNSSTTGSDRSSSEFSSERSSSLSNRSPRDPAGTGLNIRPNLLKSPVSEKADEKPEKKSVFSFLHHKKPTPEHATSTNPPFHCKWGRSCRIPVRTVCQTGRVWNSSSCSQYDQYSWFDACRSLADQLAAERERMRLGNDPGESLRYQNMLNQYRQCTSRHGNAPFSSYLFSDASFVPYF